MFLADCNLLIGKRKESYKNDVFVSKLKVIINDYIYNELSRIRY